MTTDKLTLPEIADYQRLKKVVAEGQAKFIEVGEALVEIKDRRLYRKEYASFDEFCETVCGFKRRRGNQICQAFKWRESQKLLKDKGEPVTVPDTETQATAQMESGQSTAHLDSSNKETLSPLLDSTGYPIPDKMVAMWERTGEVAEFVKMLGIIIRTLEKAQEAQDLLWSYVPLGSALADLKNAQRQLSHGRPFAVCLTCQGHPEVQPNGQCRTCKGRGFVSKIHYETSVDPELKRIRHQAAQNLKHKSTP